MAFKLLRKRIACKMQGRDIGKGLIALSKKLMPQDEIPAKQCAELIEKWRAHECDIAYANDHTEKVAGITGRAESLMAVLEEALVENAGELRREITELFARDSGMVTLSTGHRAKGLEWPVVIHLDPWRIPSRHAKKAADAGDPRQMEAGEKSKLRYRNASTEGSGSR